MTEVGKKSKILLVEDDIFMVELLAREITGANFEVLLAKTGKEAIKKLGEVSPDLVLLDILLPDMNGIEVLRAIRQSPGQKSVKVMILSNISEGSQVNEAKSLGISEYLVKANTSLPEIADKVKKVLAS